MHTKVSNKGNERKYKRRPERKSVQSVGGGQNMRQIDSY